MISFSPVVLASTSPQRRLLLEQMGLDFVTHALDCPEDHLQSADAEVLVRRICEDKLRSACRQIPRELQLTRGILCSDTMIALDHHRLGKPADRAEARRFLDLLGGRIHQVITGVIFLPAMTGHSGRDPVYRQSVSNVRIRQLDGRDLDWYLDTGEWQEAAGAYRIQGRGACLIEEIQGSWTGIMGLPLEIVFDILASGQ